MTCSSPRRYNCSSLYAKSRVWCNQIVYCAHVDVATVCKLSKLSCLLLVRYLPRYHLLDNSSRNALVEPNAIHLFKFGHRQSEYHHRHLTILGGLNFFGGTLFHQRQVVSTREVSESSALNWVRSLLWQYYHRHLMILRGLIFFLETLYCTKVKR